MGWQTASPFCINQPSINKRTKAKKRKRQHEKLENPSDYPTH